MLVNRTQLAEIFNVHIDTVRSWVRQGAPVAREPPASTKGLANDQRARMFDTGAVFHWYVNRLASERRW